MNIPGGRSRLTALKTGLGRYYLALALCAACVFVVSAQTLRVVTYNIAADVNGFTTPRDGLHTVLETIGQQDYAGV